MPYVECPRVEKPPAKNMIARTIRMISSKTRVRLSAYSLFHCETTALGRGRFVIQLSRFSESHSSVRHGVPGRGSDPAARGWAVRHLMERRAHSATRHVLCVGWRCKEVRVADKQRAEKRGLQPSEGEPDRMDWPVPGSGDKPRPDPGATGFMEPIEAVADASGTKVHAEAPASRQPGTGSKP